MKKTIITRTEKEWQNGMDDYEKELQDYWKEIQTCPVCGELGEIDGFPSISGWIFEKYIYFVKCKKCECRFDTKVKYNEKSFMRESRRIWDNIIKGEEK